MIKEAVKYQLIKFGETIRGYYATMLVVLMLAIYLMKTRMEGVIVTGVEGITIIVIFALALSSFADTLKMFLQNGISRQTIFLSYLMTVTGMSFIMAFISKMTTIILRFIFKEELAVSSTAYIRNHSMLKSLDGFLQTVKNHMIAAMLGYFISIIYYRMSKKLRSVVFYGGLALVPAISMTAPYNQVSRTLYEWIIIWTASIVKFIIQNNYYLINVVLLCILGSLSYQLLKKIVVVVEEN